MSRQIRVNRQFLLKIAAPTIAISGMLVTIGVMAAWNVQSQYVGSSELIAREVHSMFAAQDLYNELRDIRYLLQRYLRVRDGQILASMFDLRRSAPMHVMEASRLARTEAEIAAMHVVELAWEDFVNDIDGPLAKVAEGNAALDDGLLLERLIVRIDNVMTPARNFLDLNRDVVDKTNESNRRTAEQARQAFLLLGICGGAGGLIAGLMIARSISESIVQLDVSVRGATGKLSDVIGPLKISRSGTFRELEAGLQEMQNHVATIVERLQRHELEALHREQLAAMGQLAAGLAHELRNPLMPIKMLVQAALERDDDQGLRGEQLVVIESEVSRLEKSLQDFLDFARPLSPEKSLLNLQLLIEQTMELVAGRAERQHVRVVDDFPNAPVMVEADAAQLRQVLLNLLLNSFDAMPAGGEVEVALKLEQKPESTTPGQNWVTISFRDSGTGFASDIVPRLFQPFASTKETGTGLGLSICQRIVEAHGGIITAGNRPAGGAEVTIALLAAA